MALTEDKKKISSEKILLIHKAIINFRVLYKSFFDKNPSKRYVFLQMKSKSDIERASFPTYKDWVKSKMN